MPRSEFADAIARLRDTADAGGTIADEPTGKALLRAAGVATPEGRVVATPDEAVVAATDIGWPVALKIVAPGLAHKSDVDGVSGPLESVKAVRQAALGLLSRLGGQLLVESWETGGTHCFVGLSLHGPLGPVVSLGVGGIWVEVLRDVAHRAAPVTADEAVEALLSLRGAALFRGARGRAPVELEALGNAVACISRLGLEPGVSGLLDELDVNPMLVRAAGVPVALDCTVVLATRALSLDEPERVEVVS